jgi:Restriction endonuclease
VGDLLRHLHFGLAGDLHDIADLDWPDVKPRIVSALYGDREPLPVENVDLAALAAQSSSSRVPTALDFSVLDDERFERLIFSLFSSTDGYENVSWLMETRAADRGRDLAVDRVTVDTLAGTIRERIIVQCKAWRRSLSPTDCQAAIAPLSLWEPPEIDVLIIATTGRFSADAVMWIERHNNDGARPKIQPWANSNLETMLASRSDLITRFSSAPRARSSSRTDRRFLGLARLSPPPTNKQRESCARPRDASLSSGSARRHGDPGPLTDSGRLDRVIAFAFESGEG